MYTVLVNPPVKRYRRDGTTTLISPGNWIPRYERQSISENAQLSADIRDFDELHYELVWGAGIDPLVVIKEDLRSWLTDNNNQWEDGRNTRKLIKPLLPELIIDPAKINNWLGVIEKLTGWF